MGARSAVLAIVFIGCLSAVLVDKSIIGIDLGTSPSCVGVYINGDVEIIPNDQGNRTTPSWVAFTDLDRHIGKTAKKQAAPLDKSIIGIDLGTNSSCVGVNINGHVEIIPNDQGNRITPSWVAFTDSDILIGEAAKNQAALNPKRTIFDVKELIGRKFEDKEVQRLMKVVPYTIVNKDGKPYIQVEIKDGETELFSPEEITAMILTKMKRAAEAFLGKIITEAVVSVPAYFSDAQRRATMDACLIAGLKDASLITEHAIPVYAYGLDKTKVEKNILVINLVDGKCDVTIFAVDDDGILDGIGMANLEGRLNNNVNLFMGIMEKAMKESELKKHQIDDIILVGTSTEVKQRVRDYFNGKVEPKMSVNPDEEITIGAAIIGDQLARGEWGNPMC